MIPYGKQYLDEADIAAVTATLKSDFLTQGPKTEEFEQALADFCGAKYAVVLNSGTAALHAAYFAIGLGAGDEFITSPITFVATANAGLYLGARPVFADVEPDTGNIDIAAVKAQITAQTKAIVPVHYSGHPVDLEPLSDLAQKHGLALIEDACHAIGAKYKNHKIGSCRYSQMTIFSFHPVKHITTGEGGAVLTNDKELYQKLLLFRSHGITKEDLVGDADGPWYYEMQALGYNYRLTDLQAALGLTQLKKLPGFIARRRAIVETYNREFRDNHLFETPVERDYALNSYHLYPIRLKDEYKDQRLAIFNELRAMGLGVQVHYIPVYRQPYYQQLGYASDHLKCVNAESFYQRELCLPLFPAMTDTDVRSVLDTIQQLRLKYK